MPYIKEEQRRRLRGLVENLADQITSLVEDPGELAGILNYTITTLILRVLPARRYYWMALMKGVLKDVSDEFTRRYQSPYEDEKIKEHGDVY